MKNTKNLIINLALIAVVAVPNFTFAAVDPGIKPGSFLYFFDTAAENIVLFFTFDPGNKVKKALEYADERLAEAQASADENNSDAVKTAITNYESSIALASEESKQVEDKQEAEELFNSITDKATKQQEVLSAVLIKVPEEAKEAITKAIEASKKGQEHANMQIAELRQEVADLKKEIADLREQKKMEPTFTDGKKSVIQELKKEIEGLKKQESIMVDEKNITEKISTNTISLPPVVIPKTEIIQVPVKEEKQDESPKSIEISSVVVTPSLTSVRIEFQTNILTNAKIFIAGGNVYNSESGLSTRHVFNFSNLNAGTSYVYEIESVVGNQVVKKQGNFNTIDKSEILVTLTPARYPTAPLDGTREYSFKVSVLDKMGRYTRNATVSMDAPDNKYSDIKKYEPAFNGDPVGYALTNAGPRQTNGITNDQLNDWNTSFSYVPMTSGIKIITFTSGSVSKKITLEVAPYVKIDPKIEKLTLYQNDENGVDRPVESPILDLNKWGYDVVAKFKIMPGDMPIFNINKISYESDIPEYLLIFPYNLNVMDYYPVNASIRIKKESGTEPNYKLLPGKHYLTINELTVGNNRSVVGLPITFTFEVK